MSMFRSCEAGDDKGLAQQMTREMVRTAKVLRFRVTRGICLHKKCRAAETRIYLQIDLTVQTYSDDVTENRNFQIGKASTCSA